MRRIVELAHFTDSTVLILGESGTGKELVARLCTHLVAREKTGEFVVLDCATAVPELSGSEFFGHERGAFTGAVQARDGAFALADKGTLFLDEVGELPFRCKPNYCARCRSTLTSELAAMRGKPPIFGLYARPTRTSTKQCSRVSFATISIIGSLPGSLRCPRSGSVVKISSCWHGISCANYAPLGTAGSGFLRAGISCAARVSRQRARVVAGDPRIMDRHVG